MPPLASQRRFPATTERSPKRVSIDERGALLVIEASTAIVAVRNELEGRRLRRPRYQGEHTPFLGIGEAPGGASASHRSLANFQAVIGNLRGEDARTFLA